MGAVQVSYNMSCLVVLVESLRIPHMHTLERQVGGVTVYSFAGIGQGKEPKELLVKQVLGRRDKVSTWRQLDVLIIDEISMLSAEILEKVEFVAQEVRKKKKLFGGVQLILSGDFYQLPPVCMGFRFGALYV